MCIMKNIFYSLGKLSGKFTFYEKNKHKIVIYFEKQAITFVLTNISFITFILFDLYK